MNFLINPRNNNHSFISPFFLNLTNFWYHSNPCQTLLFVILILLDILMSGQDAMQRFVSLTDLHPYGVFVNSREMLGVTKTKFLSVLVNPKEMLVGDVKKLC